MFKFSCFLGERVGKILFKFLFFRYVNNMYFCLFLGIGVYKKGLELGNFNVVIFLIN